MPVEMKRCKVYPRNGLQFIPGILEKQKRIEFPAELPLSPHEIRRCLSYADVYEVRDDDCVLLTMENYLADNSEATAATDVPEDELLYPRDEEDEEEGGEEEEETEEESSVDTQSAQTSKVAAKAVSSESNKQTTSYTKDAEVEAEKNNK